MYMQNLTYLSYKKVRYGLNLADFKSALKLKFTVSHSDAFCFVVWAPSKETNASRADSPDLDFMALRIGVLSAIGSSQVSTTISTTTSMQFCG